MVGPSDNPMWWALGPYGGASARQQQMAMAYENAKLGKQGQIGAAELGATASMFGAKQGAAGSLAKQGMAGEQGMAEQKLRGEQAMGVAGLQAGTTMRGQDLANKLGMKNYRSVETARLTGGGGMEGGGTGIQNAAWENSKKRFDAFMETTGGYDKDTGKEFTPEQKDSMLKGFYSQEIGFFGNR